MVMLQPVALFAETVRQPSSMPPECLELLVLLVQEETEKAENGRAL